MAWLITFLALCSAWLAIAWRFGPQHAVGAVVLVACAVPTWCQQDLFGLPLDVRVASTIFALVAYCFHPRATFPWRLGWIDACMLLLLAVHALSDAKNSGWQWTTPLRIYGEWCVPYLAGRLALHNLDTLPLLAPIGTTVALLLAAGSIVESTTTLHPWEWFYGERFYDGISRNAHRWGLLRAWGCCGHPIYFGVLQLLFLPWLLRAWYAARGSSAAMWAWLLPMVGILGIVGSGSRGPVLAAVGLLAMSAAALMPRTRPYFAVAIALLLGASIAYREQVLDALRHSIGEAQRVAEGPRIEADSPDGAEAEWSRSERPRMTSGTQNRLDILRVYARAVARAGWLGFGTESVTGFPISVPLGPDDVSALKENKYVDNEYLLLTLRFGWIGGTLFAIALVLSIASWLHRSRVASWNDRPWCVFVGSAIAATAACLMTVWMPHDIGFPLLFWMGAGSAQFTFQPLPYHR
jgi:hypothetical protein